MTCDKASHSVSWNAVAVSGVEQVSSGDVVCPGGKDTCPDQTTCCRLKSGDYGCCPYPHVSIRIHWNLTVLPFWNS